MNCTYLFPLSPIITAWVNVRSLISDREEDEMSLVFPIHSVAGFSLSW